MFSILLTLAFGQSVSLPKEVQGEIGQFVTVKPTALDGGGVEYLTLDPGLSIFPSSLLTDKSVLVFTSPKAGRYRVLAYTAKGDKPSPPSICTVVIGGAPKPDDPKPVDPKPDDPKPSVAPIPLPGLRVMIVYDSAKLAELPKEQQAILFGAETRGLLNQKCVADESGNASWRIYPKVTDAGAADKVWQDALARPRQSVPWVVVSNGKTGFEGPLPTNSAQFAELIKKYAE
jgi:hypothetical protein